VTDKSVGHDHSRGDVVAASIIQECPKKAIGDKAIPIKVNYGTFFS
jgi:hypothetical protein